MPLLLVQPSLMPPKEEYPVMLDDTPLKMLHTKRVLFFIAVYNVIIISKCNMTPSFSWWHTWGKAWSSFWVNTEYSHLFCHSFAVIHWHTMCITIQETSRKFCAKALHSSFCKAVSSVMDGHLNSYSMQSALHLAIWQQYCVYSLLLNTLLTAKEFHLLLWVEKSCMVSNE